VDRERSVVGDIRLRGRSIKVLLANVFGRCSTVAYATFQRPDPLQENVVDIAIGERRLIARPAGPAPATPSPAMARAS
jgi:hypothetical protein